MNQYDPPFDSGVPNPLGPRLHNWKGGTLNEGSLYHGPVYTRPDYRLPYSMRPLRGVVENTNPSESIEVVLPLLMVGGLILTLFAMDAVGDR